MSPQDPSPDHSPTGEPEPTPASGSAAKPHGPTGSFDASSVERSDWIVLGLAFALLVCSFLPWYTVSVEVLGFDGGSSSFNGWNEWWVLIQLLVLAVLGLKAYEVFAKQTLPVPPIVLPAAGAAIVVLTLIALIDGLTSGSGVDGVDAGPGFGLWLALPLSLALTYFLALDAQKKGAKLPVRLPGAGA
ncbi:hypothetical protein [Nocardioides sp.]|uniref:hypothetical protein n=1 Tax=Nocardioides sp. TaxID=35761 RepID=UPI002C46D826|nr:hypothetical protein [Nocardioides sp.]HXH78901.1 hypothetical protein [Nocardioides sp.]